MDVRRQLGFNMRRLREAQGHTQEGFAELAGLHRTYVSDLERGTRNPTITVVMKVAQALGVKPGQLLDD